jgi:integrase
VARKTNILTAKMVRELTDPGKYPDGEKLYLEIGETGTKRWTYIFRFAGKRRQKGFGSVSEVSLKQARDKRREADAMVREGINPIEADRPLAQSHETATFGAVALEYIAGREAGWKNAKHRQQWPNTLRTYAKAIWNMPVDAIGVTDVLKILKPIWHKKAETAKRVRSRIEKVLGAATVLELRSGHNPAAWRGNLEHLLGTQRKGPKRHQPAMPYAAAPSFLADLKDRDSLAARALELLIHTATRTAEVLNARWSEFDLERRIWIIPAERMKAGKQHRVPLTPQAMQLLKSLAGHRTFLFPGQSNSKPLSNMAMLMLLRRMEVEHVTVHGFRSTFRDWVGECTNEPREIAEMALAHEVGNEVERAYRRGDALDKRRKLMERWSNYLSGQKSTAD